jgi:hypothetical protein
MLPFSLPGLPGVLYRRGNGQRHRLAECYAGHCHPASGSSFPVNLQLDCKFYCGYRAFSQGRLSSFATAVGPPPASYCRSRPCIMTFQANHTPVCAGAFLILVLLWGSRFCRLPRSVNKRALSNEWSRERITTARLALGWRIHRAQSFSMSISLKGPLHFTGSVCCNKESEQ